MVSVNAQFTAEGIALRQEYAGSLLSIRRTQEVKRQEPHLTPISRISLTGTQQMTPNGQFKAGVD